MIEKMTYVQIYKSVLSEDKRSPNLPHDTKRVPLEMRVKGKLMESAEIGDFVKIRTATNRIETGILIVAEPHFSHSFGHHVQVLNDVRDIILKETEDL